MLPITTSMAGRWGAMPLPSETLTFLAEEGLLNSCASSRSWFDKGSSAICSMAFWDMGRTLYAEGFAGQDFNVVKENAEKLDDEEIAKIVEAALALHVMSVLGAELSVIGVTLVFANWLARSLLTQ